MFMVLLMKQILHHLGCIKPFKSWDKLPRNWLAGILNHQQYFNRELSLTPLASEINPKIDRRFLRSKLV